MSIALIQESAKEVRRLAIAGSTLAVGDFRLKKLVPPLEQAGAKVPVFGQVAKGISNLVNGPESESAARLLSLSTLLNAILYTQGRTGTDGESCDLPTFPIVCNTRTSARALKPLVEALTSSGAGRYEMINSACARGAFNDLRLIHPAIQALGDTYPELADLVAEKILPGYGAGIVPLLKAGLNLKGKKQDARRLTVMHQLDPAGTLDLCRTALEEGSAEVKAAAIAGLGQHEDCLPLVMEQANAKNKVLRAAALQALAAHDRPEITTLFTELIKGKTLEVLAQPLRTLRNQQVLSALLAEGTRVLNLVLKPDQDQLVRYAQILDCLHQRKDAEVEAFLLTCFSHCEKLLKIKAAKNSVIEGADLVARLAALLYETGSTASMEAILTKRNALPPMAFGHVLRSALRNWPAERVYDEFAPLLQQKKGAAKERREELERTLLAAHRHNLGDVSELLEDESTETGAPPNQGWDPRWLDAAIVADQQMIVCCLARPGHNAALTYLVKQLETKNEFQSGWIIQALARCQYPKLTEAFLELVVKKTKNSRYFDYDLQLLFGSARHLPVADLPRLDAFAAKLDEKFMDRYLEALQPLRQASTGQTHPI